MCVHCRLMVEGVPCLQALVGGSHRRMPLVGALHCNGSRAGGTKLEGQEEGEGEEKEKCEKLMGSILLDMVHIHEGFGS